MMMMMNKEH